MSRFRSFLVPLVGLAIAACGGASTASSSEGKAENGEGAGGGNSGMGGASNHTNSRTDPPAMSTMGGTIAAGGTTAVSGPTAAAGTVSAAGTDSVTQKGGSSPGTGGTVSAAGTDSVTQKGGSSPGTGGTSSTVQSTPEECQVPLPANSALPQRITFRVVNAAPTAVFFVGSSTCSLIPKLQSCADKYQQAITSTPGCAQSCASNVTGCMVCGGCPQQAKEVPPGAAIDADWSGLVFAHIRSASPGCMCFNESTAPVGRYRASITVYPTQDIPSDGTGSSRTVTVDFSYPDDDGIVVLNL